MKQKYKIALLLGVVLFIQTEPVLSVEKEGKKEIVKVRKIDSLISARFCAPN